MIELFRYIEQSFVRPASKDNSVDLGSDSDFQNKIRSERNQPSAGEKIRRDAQEFIDANFAESPSGKVRLGEGLLAFHHDVLGLKSPTAANIDQLIAKIFDESAQEVTQWDDFRQDKEFLGDSIVAVKLITAFDKVNTADLVAMRQAIEFLTQVAAGQMDDLTHEQLRTSLLRPMLIPASLFAPKAAAKPPDDGPGNGEADEQAKRIEKLQKEADELKTTYEALMAIRADELEVVALKDTHDLAVLEKRSLALGSEELNAGVAEAAPRSIVTLSRAVVDRLPDAVSATLKRSNIDISQTALPTIVEKVKENWSGVSRELEPYLTPAPINVYQLGIHTFAVQPLAKLTTPSLPVPDFSHAITRPVGIGNLQVVRQELMGYEPGEVSHIENVLEGELYRRATRRSESTDLTITTETETIQSEERDLQSTERNEMATETQKEASKQTVATQGQNSTTDYGKLVENSKTNYARSVSDRAVNSLTQRTKEQRIKREQRSYTEKTVHEFDNSTWTTKVRGIYQWVDKKYKMRIMNYGERLLYDVVIPEPAAFLIDSLKRQQQPEAFQLVKPFAPWFFPQELNTSNYMALARFYGVTGSVQPPPDEFVSTIAEVRNDKVEKIGEVKFYSTKLRIPDGYQAIHGYVTRLTHQSFNEKNLADDAKNKTGVDLEFMIGEQYLLRFGPGPASLKFAWEPFTMANEEGELPVLFRSFSPVAEWGFAIGINCKRLGLENWQLKTFAALTEGYRRQNAEYEDKLAQRQAIVRTQMMLAQNFARNPSAETTELKRMFIHLLVSEHLTQVGFPPPISDPFFFLTDPAYVKKWGAVVAFFERAFEWENIMYFYYPYFYGRLARWGELVLIQDLNPQFEEFLKAGAARVVIPVRPGFEAALAHYHETGDVWMGEEMPDMFSDLYVSIIDEIKARNFGPGEEVCVAEWDVKLPTTLVMLKDDATLPEWKSTVKCGP
jgi:hypothetical protein